MIIAHGGIGRPNQELLNYIGVQDDGSERKVATGGDTGIPNTNTRFSLVHNDIHSSIYAVGGCAEYPSFIQK